MIKQSDTNRGQLGRMYRVGSNRGARLLGEEKVGQPTAFRKLTVQRIDEKHLNEIIDYSATIEDPRPVVSFQATAELE